MWVAWIAAAVAGELFVNGTRVDPASLAGAKLDKVTVTFDDQGNTHIEAPGYKVKIVERPGGPPAPAPGPAVPAATYWLVTQDLKSEGHTVDVIINGRTVLTVRSGQEQVIQDLAKHLKPGSNTIVMSSRSKDPAGGSFYVFVGEGEDDAGTVRIDEPVVEYGLGPANKGAYERSYTLRVP